MFTNLTAAFTEETPQREFALADVITAYSDVTFRPESEQASEEIWKFLTGDARWEKKTEFCRMLDRQCPYLAGMMGELFPLLNHEKRSEVLATWLNNQEGIYGKTVMLRRLYIDMSISAKPYEEVSLPLPGAQLNITI